MKFRVCKAGRKHRGAEVAAFDDQADARAYADTLAERTGFAYIVVQQETTERKLCVCKSKSGLNVVTSPAA